MRVLATHVLVRIERTRIVEAPDPILGLPANREVRSVHRGISLPLTPALLAAVNTALAERYPGEEIVFGDAVARDFIPAE